MTNFSIDSLASLPIAERERIVRSLTPEEALDLIYSWRVWARPEQIAPDGDWDVWLINAGRGFGKTRSGAEWVHEQIDDGVMRIALVGRTAADCRDVMVEGESGLLATAHPLYMPRYESSKARVIWPNGAIAKMFSAEEPEALRGPQHEKAWCDETGAWRYAQETWDQLQMVLRLGKHPQAVVTTTPRPTPVIKSLLADKFVQGNGGTIVTGGSTYANKSNLAKSFIRKLLKKYEGTRLGRQELHAELLDDNPGALWKRPVIDDLRVSKIPDLVRIVVAVDPAVTAELTSDETGIVVAGLGSDGHGYVLDDKSILDSPAVWAKEVVAAYRKWKADRIVAEVNNGGDLVETNIRTVDRDVAYRAVHASRGKAIRAEPISALYEQGRVHHVGSFPKLEDELCDWDPTSSKRSPNRLDALVWGLTELMLEGGNDDGVLLVGPSRRR